jgi:hypothetical protein
LRAFLKRYRLTVSIPKIKAKATDEVYCLDIAKDKNYICQFDIIDLKRMFLDCVIGGRNGL